MSHGGLCILANASNLVTVVVIGGALIVAIVVIGLVVMPYVRRKYHPASQEGPRPAGGFDIEHLESMRRRGEISQEEFRALRRAALGLEDRPRKAADSPSSAPAACDDDEDAVGPEEGPQVQPGAPKE